MSSWSQSKIALLRTLCGTSKDFQRVVNRQNIYGNIKNSIYKLKNINIDISHP